MNEPRKSWYGDGRQPWDDIVDSSWGPAFAAGNVLKYLRRAKDPAHSIESARWYYARLAEHSVKELKEMTYIERFWTIALHQLQTLQRPEEMRLLNE